MKNHHAFLFATFFILAACKNQKEANSAPPGAGKKNYFPVADFLRSEIHYVDSLPLGILKCKVKNNHSDSSFINPDEFNQLAEEFIPPVLTSAAFENDYEESSFIDQTTQSVAFTYATKNKNQELQRIDVLAKSNEGNNQVLSIYLEKMSEKNNEQVRQKMYWKARKSFLIVTTRRSPGQPPVVSQLKVIWDRSN
jgi:hypothetical protein